MPHDQYIYLTRDKPTSVTTVENYGIALLYCGVDACDDSPIVKKKL